MSGLSRTPGKRVWANPHRGFESRPLRQGCASQGLKTTHKTPEESPVNRGFVVSRSLAKPFDIARNLGDSLADLSVVRSLGLFAPTQI